MSTNSNSNLQRSSTIDLIFSSFENIKSASSITSLNNNNNHLTSTLMTSIPDKSSSSHLYHYLQQHPNNNVNHLHNFFQQQQPFYLNNNCNPLLYNNPQSHLNLNQHHQLQDLISNVHNENNKNNDYSNNSNNQQQHSFHIIRNVLSMLNGLNVETVKKNPNDIFMLLKKSFPLGNDNCMKSSSSNFKLDDETCQLIIRVGGLGKILLKIINYLNYYQTIPRMAAVVAGSGNPNTIANTQGMFFQKKIKNSTATSTTSFIINSKLKKSTSLKSVHVSYPMFADEYTDSKTLGNIKQYFVNSVHQLIKDYHYDLLMIESKFRSSQSAGFQIPYQLALRRLLLWSQDWLDRYNNWLVFFS